MATLIQLNLATKEEKPVWTFADSLVAFDAWDVAGSELFYAGIEPERPVSQLFVVDLDSGVVRLDRLGWPVTSGERASPHRPMVNPWSSPKSTRTMSG